MRISGFSAPASLRAAARSIRVPCGPVSGGGCGPGASRGFGATSRGAGGGGGGGAAAGGGPAAGPGLGPAGGPGPPAAQQATAPATTSTQATCRLGFNIEPTFEGNLSGFIGSRSPHEREPINPTLTST